METRICQNCKQDFTIEPEDFAFYEKIKVPPPTFCPECRMIRRMLWRNERVLYKRDCGATGRRVITIFAPDKDYTVYDREYWWGDGWDPKTYGQEYDFSKPFFQQFSELMHSVPLPSVANTNCVHSDYGNHNADCKDCYLTFASWKNEFVHYSLGMIGSSNSLDCYKSTSQDKSYFNTLSDTDYKVFYSYMADECTDSMFVDHSRNLHSCIGCVNQRSKTNCIFNEQLSKEEYAARKHEIDFGSHAQLSAFKKKFEEFSKKFPKRFANNIKAQDCTGDYIVNAKNCKKSFDVYEGVENCKYVAHVVAMKDSYDIYGGVGELLYEGVDVGIQAGNYIGGVLTHGCHEVRYTYNCHSSSYLFGCVGLRGAKYCILNKQYTKEEYEELVPRIVEHMMAMPYIDKRGIAYRFGEFFPEEIAPFAYNETIAAEYFPKTRAEVESNAYVWHDEESRHYEVTIQTDQLPDHIRDVKDTIVQEIIGCSHNGECNHMCTTAFRVTAEELSFLKQMNIALPRECPNCRHFERLGKRTPMKLWHRQCMCEEGSHGHAGKCDNEFETSYAPERPEKIYCESCYQKEVI